MNVNWFEIYLLTAFLKLFLFYSYHSTDFEVHRNWLALTYSLPRSKWYYEVTSKWTLDYPPFFAWFEYILSLAAQYVDPTILQISETPIFSETVLLFQRCSVIVSDVVLCYGSYKANQHVVKSRGDGDDLTVKLLLGVLYLGSAGLLIVDHIHFQYNGLLSGVFLLSLVAVAEDRIVLGGFYFSVLLNLKHIYLYVAPVYFVYMLRCHVYQSGRRFGVDLVGLSKLGGCVVAVFGMSLGPFISHIPQILSRLFPVQRGLCHAYWAPNFWTLYNSLDIGLSKALQLLQVLPSPTSVHPLMSGLVQQAEFTILPNITPLHCGTLTLVAMTPALIRLFRAPSSGMFVKSVTYAAFTSYLFGYHVHEKAVLVILIPYGLLVFQDKNSAVNYFVLSAIGTYSLFPLLFEPREFVIKVVILLMTHSFMYPTLKRVYPDFELSMFERVFLWGLVPHFVVSEVLLPIFLAKFEFLPLILYSSYCMVGVIYSYFKLFQSIV